MAVVLTKEEIKSEILKCGKNPTYFLRNYAKITHPDRGNIPFKTYPFQDDLLDKFRDHRFNVIAKARQLGISTIVAGYISWMILFYRDKNILVMATKYSTASNMVKKVKHILKNLPEWLTISKVTIDNKHSFELSNGSQVKAIPTSEDAGRSEAVSLLVVDEAAHIENMEDIWTAIYPTISTGGRCIALSSPNGIGNWFHKTYEDALNSQNSFVPTILPWNVHPEHNQEWFENETKNLAKREIAQEYLCFDGETRLFTDKGYRKIKDLKIGDMVLTHKGRFKPIVEHRSRISNNVYKINTFFNRNFSYVTGEHPILNEENTWQEIQDINSTQRISCISKNIVFDKKSSKIDLLKISTKFFKTKLTEDDRVYQNDRRHKTKHNRFIKVDYNFGKLVGFFMSEGSYRNSNISIAFNYEKELNTWVKDLQDYLSKTIGIDTHKVYNTGKSGNLLISSALLTSLLKELVSGEKCYNKHLSGYTYSIANKEFLKGVLDGIFKGDGCLLEKYNKTLNITSLDMIYDVKYILSLFGYGYFSVRNSSTKTESVINGKKVNLKNHYTLKLLRTNNIKIKEISDLLNTSNKIDVFNTSYKNIYNNTENYYTCRILTKEKQLDPITVYNIQVEEDESYVTEHFVTHNCSFNASGETVIDPDEIERLRKSVCEPTKKSWMDRNYHVWKPYNAQGKYLLCADVARGDGQDYSVFHIINVNTMEQVAEYQGKVEPEHFVKLVFDTGIEYGNAMVCIETNNIGYTVAQKLVDMGYKNLYYSHKSTHEYVHPNAAIGNSNIVPGFTTSVKTRPLIIAKLDEFIRNKVVTINSARLVRELEKFIWSNGRPEAQKGYNDDLVMALAIACWVRDTTLIVNQKEIQLNLAILNSISKGKTTLNTSIPGMDRHRQIEIDNAKKVYKDFAWILKG